VTGAAGTQDTDNARNGTRSATRRALRRRKSWQVRGSGESAPLQGPLGRVARDREG